MTRVRALLCFLFSWQSPFQSSKGLSSFLLIVALPLLTLALCTIDSRVLPLALRSVVGRLAAGLAAFFLGFLVVFLGSVFTESFFLRF